MVSGHTGVRGEDRALERDPFPRKCVCGAGTQGECVDDLPGDQGLRDQAAQSVSLGTS